jgi:hypothetical protein
MSSRVNHNWTRHLDVEGDVNIDGENSDDVVSIPAFFSPIVGKEEEVDRDIERKRALLQSLDETMQTIDQNIEDTKAGTATVDVKMVENEGEICKLKQDYLDAYKSSTDLNPQEREDLQVKSTSIDKKLKQCERQLAHCTKQSVTLTKTLSKLEKEKGELDQQSQAEETALEHLQRHQQRRKKRKVTIKRKCNHLLHQMYHGLVTIIPDDVDTTTYKDLCRTIFINLHKWFGTPMYSEDKKDYSTGDITIQNYDGVVGVWKVVRENGNNCQWLEIDPPAHPLESDRLHVLAYAASSSEGSSTESDGSVYTPSGTSDTESDSSESGPPRKRSRYRETRAI